MNTLNANENLMEIVKNMDVLTEKEIFEKLGKFVRKETNIGVQGVQTR